MDSSGGVPLAVGSNPGGVLVAVAVAVAVLDDDTAASIMKFGVLNASTLTTSKSSSATVTFVEFNAMMKYKFENVLSCSYVSTVQVYLEVGGVLVLSGAWDFRTGPRGRSGGMRLAKEDPPGSWPRIRIVMLPETEGEEGKVAVPFELALFAHVPDVGDFSGLGWLEEVGGGCGCHGDGRAGVLTGFQVPEDRRRDHFNTFSCLQNKNRHEKESISIPRGIPASCGPTTWWQACVVVVGSRITWKNRTPLQTANLPSASGSFLGNK